MECLVACGDAVGKERTQAVDHVIETHMFPPLVIAVL